MARYGIYDLLSNRGSVAVGSRTTHVPLPLTESPGHYDQDVYFITPNHFLPNLNDPCLLDPLRRMDITLAVGEHDPFHESNLLLSRALADKGVSHRLAIWPGEAHRARCWREMAPHYL